LKNALLDIRCASLLIFLMSVDFSEPVYPCGLLSVFKSFFGDVENLRESDFVMVNSCAKRVSIVIRDLSYRSMWIGHCRHEVPVAEDV
jgi:hypothetical protein